MNSTEQQEKTIAWIGYALYGAAIVTGGLCALAAVILNYIKRGDCQSELVKSHINYQIGTFWRSIIYAIIVAVVTFILYLTIVGILFAWIIWIAYAVWYIYRVVKGIMALNSNRAIA